MMTEMALMTGREVAELVQTIEEPMTPEGLKVVKEETGVATLGVILVAGRKVTTTQRAKVVITSSNNHKLLK